jgi:hypothetical protein
MKRFLIPLFIGGALIASAFAAAETLEVKAGVLQAGNDKTLSCQPNSPALDIHFIDEQAGISGDVDKVKVENIHSDCKNAQLLVEVFSNDDCKTGLLGLKSVKVTTTPTLEFTFDLTNEQVEQAQCVRVKLIGSNDGKTPLNNGQQP